MTSTAPSQPPPDESMDEDVEDEAVKSDRDLDNDIPGLEPITISFYGADYPIDALHQRLHPITESSAGDIEIPEFQRGYVWRKHQADRFIESLLLGLPVPGIFLSQDPETKRLQIIDGVQRLLTIKRFMDGSSGNLQNVHSSFDTKSFSDLSAADTREFKDRIIHATIIRPDNTPEDRMMLSHLFDRLNTGGTPAQPHEVRKSLWRGPFNDLIEVLNENEDWRSIYGKHSARVKDQELILRFIALYKGGEIYGEQDRTMKNFLTSFMARHRNLTQFSAEQIQETFEGVIGLVNNTLRRRAFRPEGRLNTAVFDAVMVGLSEAYNSNHVPEPTDFRQAYEELLQNEEFLAATSSRTSHVPNVETRLRLARQAFKP